MRICKMVKNVEVDGNWPNLVKIGTTWKKKFVKIGETLGEVFGKFVSIREKFWKMERIGEIWR